MKCVEESGKMEDGKKEPKKRVSVVSVKAVREKSIFYEGRRICDPEDAVRLVMPFVENADREHLLVCCMNGKNEPVSLEVAAIGTINQCLVGVREVFKNAILCNAAAILLFHNHPSGDCEPSQDDLQISHRLRKCGELLGIPILDHIILGHNSFKSLAETMEWKTWRGNEEEIIKA